MDEYSRAFKESVEDPENFWSKAANELVWYDEWERVLDASNIPFYRWFKGGRINTCYNAVDRHVEEGRGGQNALIYDSPVTNTVEKFTYSQLKDRVSRIAGFLRGLGVDKGDTVIIYMPMIPEALMSMLACARIGAVHSVVFGGFSAKELAIRIDDAKPKVMLAASCGIEKARIIEYTPLLEKAVDIAKHVPEKIVIKQRPECRAVLKEGRDLDWDSLEGTAEPVDCVPLDANDPLYILYTSGTTGKPKGVVRDNGGHAVALRWTMKHIYGIEPGDVFWSASDVGWVVGHSYIIYAPLLTGATTVMYEGKPVGTPDAGQFWRVLEEHNVKVLFTAPTAIRVVKRVDPLGEHLEKYDLSCFDTLFLAGERTDPDTYHWAKDLLKVPVIDHWWQTETGWAIAANFRGLTHYPTKPGSVTKPVPGWDVRILDPLSGKEMPAGEQGVIAVKLPLPPGTFITLWKDEEAYEREYMTEYPGYYFTGDGGYVDEDGYVFVMGRVDDIINVAGHRLSTGSMEEAVSKHPDIAECAVLGVADQLKGEVPIGFLVLKSGVERSHDDIVAEVVGMVRSEVGPVASFKKAVVVDHLPKTRSGKILRSTMRSIADDKEYNMPSTIEDPKVLCEIKEAVKKIGYGKSLSQ